VLFRSAVVVPSGYVARVLARFGVDRRRMRLVAPGTQRVEPGERPRSPGPVRFVCVANLSAHKRPLDLIEAFSRADVDASLTLVGGAPDERLAARVRARLRAADVAGRARWLGPLAPDRAGAAIAAADAFVLPALHESYGMAVAEAMAAGLPAIVARSGNAPALVRDGLDGLVVPARDAGALAAAIRRLATDERSRLEMSRSARTRAATFPTWERSAERFADVVRGVAQRAAAADRPGSAGAPAGASDAA